MSACSNCGSSQWAAKNDTYCTCCENQWWEAWAMTVYNTPNPLQFFADKIINNHKTGESNDNS